MGTAAGIRTTLTSSAGTPFAGTPVTQNLIIEDTLLDANGQGISGRVFGDPLVLAQPNNTLNITVLENVTITNQVLHGINAGASEGGNLNLDITPEARMTMDSNAALTVAAIRLFADSTIPVVPPPGVNFGLSTVTARLDNIDITNTGGPGVDVETSGNARVDIEASDLNITNAGDGFFVVLDNNNGSPPVGSPVSRIVVENSTIDTLTGRGMAYFTFGDVDAFISVTGSTITGAGTSGIELTTGPGVGGTADILLNLDDNSITGNDTGLTINSVAGADVRARITDTDFSGNATIGLALTSGTASVGGLPTADAAELTVLLDGISAVTSGNPNMSVTNHGVSEVCLAMTNNTFDDSINLVNNDVDPAPNPPGAGAGPIPANFAVQLDGASNTFNNPVGAPVFVGGIGRFDVNTAAFGTLCVPVIEAREALFNP